MIATCCDYVDRELLVFSEAQVASTRSRYMNDLFFNYWVERDGGICVVYCSVCHMKLTIAECTVDGFMRRGRS